MNARMRRKSLVLAGLLVGGVLATSVPVDAAAPWFRPGGQRPTAPGGALLDRDRVRDRDRDRDQERRRSLYGEERFVRHLYQGFLNRQPSREELRTWTRRLGRDANPTELVQEFMDSDEYFVRQCYLVLLGRQPEASGLNAHMGALEDGQSRADVVEAFLASPEFRQRLR